VNDRPRSWMPMYVADYLADTSHLSAAEHGAYLLLIFHYWSNAKALPSNDKVLARIARMTTEEWKESKDVILEFFDRKCGDLVHHRIEKELGIAHERYQKRADAGRKGGKAKQKQCNSNAEPTTSTATTTDNNQKPQPKPPIAAKPPRKRDEIMDALALVESARLEEVTAPAWSKHAKAKQIILQVCPAVTPEEIRKRADNWKRHYPTCKCTSTALASHWATCADKPEVEGNKI